VKNLFGKEQPKFRKYTVFQDEAGCRKSNFFYHGFLFVRNKTGRKILNEIIEIKEKNNRRWRDISFKDITGVTADTEEGKKTNIVRSWLNLARNEIQKGNLKFYLFGANKDNLKNFWEKWSYEKSIYLRYFELGLKSSVRWFGKDKREIKTLMVSHLYYDRGDYEDERKEKASWLSYEFSKINLPEVLPNPRNISPLDSDEKCSNNELSNLIQLADVLLGVCKYSFIKIAKSHIGKQQCVSDFLDIVQRFNNKKNAYRISSKYFKNFCLNFFPTKSDLTKEEFLEKELTYFQSAGEFYCDRPTWQEQLAKEKYLKLF